MTVVICGCGRPRDFERHDGCIGIYLEVAERTVLATEDVLCALSEQVTDEAQVKVEGDG